MSKYRLCVLGNSHLGAAKLGWDRVAPDFPDFELDFFAFAPGISDKFRTHVEVADGSMIAKSAKLRQSFRLSSGGRTRVEGADYSAFITFGLGMSGPTRVARRICATHRTLGHASGGVQLVSRACLETTVQDWIVSDKMLAPFRSLRAISDAPVFFQSIPAPMASIAGDPGYAYDPCSTPGLIGESRSLFDEACRKAGEPDLYAYVPQPAETIDQSGLTKDEYIVDGVGLKVFRGRSKAVNAAHGNAKYGALVMEKLLGRLQDCAGLRSR